MNTSTENWIKDLVSMALPIRTRPIVPLSQSLQQAGLCQLLKRKQGSGLCLKGQGQALSHELDEDWGAAHEEENLCIDGRAGRPGGSSGLHGSACR